MLYTACFSTLQALPSLFRPFPSFYVELSRVQQMVLLPHLSDQISASFLTLEKGLGGKQLS
jgi:hypothetical protein